MKKVLFFAMLAMLPMLVMGQDKFGYVNSYELMMQMPEINQIEKDMVEFNKKNQDYLQTMQAELQDKAAKYEQEKETLSESMKKVKEEELQSMYDRIQNAYASFQQEAQQEQEKKLQPVKERLQAAIDSVGKKQNLLFVFDLSSGALLYKSDKAVDITAAVKKELGVL